MKNVMQLKKKLSAMSLALCLVGLSANVQADTDLMSRLIQENHQLKSQLNDAVLKQNEHQMMIEVVSKRNRELELSVAQLRDKYEALLSSSKVTARIMRDNAQSLSLAIENVEKAEVAPQSPVTTTPTALVTQSNYASPNRTITIPNGAVAYSSVMAARFNKSDARIFSAPESKADVLHHTKEGDFVLITHHINERWFKIENGGWIWKDHINY